MRKNRLGSWSAIAVIVIGGMYVVTLEVGVAVHGLATPIGDPILAIMEILTLLSALAVVLLMVAIHDYASGPRKPYGLIAVAFTIVFAGTTDWRCCSQPPCSRVVASPDVRDMAC